MLEKPGAVLHAQVPSHEETHGGTDRSLSNAPCVHRGINMTSITMAPECLDNLLPAGAGERHEADYPCFAVTPAIMYHLDGSTANTSWVPARPFTMHLLLLMSSSAGGWPMEACLYTPALGFLFPNTLQLPLLLCRGQRGGI